MGKKSKNVKKTKSSAQQPSKSIEPDSKIPQNECPGTFRWGEDKLFPKLPPPKQSSPPFSSFKGWANYFLWRGGSEFMGSVQKDMSLVDCLSSPVTLLAMMHSLKLQPGKTFNIVLLGASRRAEEFVYRNTKAWEEIAHSFKDSSIRFYFVGPETSDTCALPCDRANIECFVVKGTLQDFRRHHQKAYEDRNSTLFSIFNGGFGNFAESNRFELLWSWLPDLEVLLLKRFPIFFTCANDYGDLVGEVAVMRALQAKFILPPQENQYSFATTLVGESDSGWSRGNSFTYAVCGVHNETEMSMFTKADLSIKQMAVTRLMKNQSKLSIDKPPIWGAACQLTVIKKGGDSLKADSSGGVTVKQGGDSLKADSSGGVTMKQGGDSLKADSSGDVTVKQGGDSLKADSSGGVIMKQEGESLKVELHTHGLQSMADASLDVFKTRLEVRWAHDTSRVVQKVDLPLAVQTDGVTASFSRRKQRLTVTLRIA